MSEETTHRTVARAILAMQAAQQLTSSQVEDLIVGVLDTVKTTALEACAVLAEDTGWAIHDAERDPQADSSNVTGEKIAATIRSWVHL